MSLFEKGHPESIVMPVQTVSTALYSPASPYSHDNPPSQLEFLRPARASSAGHLEYPAGQDPAHGHLLPGGGCPYVCPHVPPLISPTLPDHDLPRRDDRPVAGGGLPEPARVRQLQAAARGARGRRPGGQTGH